MPVQIGLTNGHHSSIFSMNLGHFGLEIFAFLSFFHSFVPYLFIWTYIWVNHCTLNDCRQKKKWIHICGHAEILFSEAHLNSLASREQKENGSTEKVSLYWKPPTKWVCHTKRVIVLGWIFIVIIIMFVQLYCVLFLFLYESTLTQSTYSKYFLFAQK